MDANKWGWLKEDGIGEFLAFAVAQDLGYDRLRRPFEFLRLDEMRQTNR